MPTAGDVTLANAALALLAEEEITSFSEPADLAGKVAAIYPGTIAGLLACHPWRFTMTKRQLSRDLASPVTEWQYQHAMPADCLMLRALRPSASTAADTVTEYEIFSDKVLSNEPNLWADFQIAKPPEAFPALFYKLATHALASDLAVMVTGSVSLSGDHRATAYGPPADRGAGGLLRLARQADAQQQPPQRLRRFTLINARFGG